MKKHELGKARKRLERAEKIYEKEKKKAQDLLGLFFMIW